MLPPLVSAAPKGLVTCLGLVGGPVLIFLVSLVARGRHTQKNDQVVTFVCIHLVASSY